MEKPFIQLFKTPLNKYAFDVNKNQLLKISDNLYDYLNSDMDSEPEEVVKMLYEGLREKGYFSSNRVKLIRHPETDKLKYQLNKNMSSITLQVTQNCNFRCSYCPYTTAEFGNNRTHASKSMSFETAKKLLDFYAIHSVNRDTAAISFYGGEPLLCFPLVKKVVEYAEKLFIGKEIIFSMTTNGSLFTEEVVEFLEKHSFTVMISLDGPPKIHNRSRKFAATGKGTFETIEKNLIALYTDHREFFDKLTVNIVMDPRFSSDDIHELFSSHEMYSRLNMRATIIDEEFTYEKSVVSDEFVISERKSGFLAFMSLIGRYPKSNVSKVTLNSISNELSKSHIELKEEMPLSEMAAPGGPCIPGLKLLCDINGNFILCEKVNELSPVMQLGNIDDGWNYENAEKLLNVGSLTAEKCKICPVFRHCTLCARFCDNNGELSAELKRSKCKQVKLDFLNKLKGYAFYHELGIRGDDMNG